MQRRTASQADHPIAAFQGMAKDSINYYADKRKNAEGLAPLDIWDSHLHNLQTMEDRDANLCLPTFAAHADGILSALNENQAAAVQESAQLARHERLQRLVVLFESSNILDFIFVKAPAWWLSHQLYRYQEKRACSVSQSTTGSI